MRIPSRLRPAVRCPGVKLGRFYIILGTHAEDAPHALLYPGPYNLLQNPGVFQNRPAAHTAKVLAQVFHAYGVAVLKKEYKAGFRPVSHFTLLFKATGKDFAVPSVSLAGLKPAFLGPYKNGST